jgi:hypothetical protein
VCRRQSGKKVVLDGSDRPFRRVGAVLEGGNVLKRDVFGDEEGSEGDGSLIIQDKVRDGEGLRRKELQDFLEGRDIGRGRSSFHRKEMDKTKMFGDEDILVTFLRWDGKPARQVCGCPLGPMQG